MKLSLLLLRFQLKWMKNHLTEDLVAVRHLNEFTVMPRDEFNTWMFLQGRLFLWQRL